MHLWPTKNLRDSFKISYLRRLEWNNRRMEMEKDQQSSTEQKLLESDNQDNRNGQAPNLLNCEAGCCWFSLAATVAFAAVGIIGVSFNWVLWIACKMYSFGGFVSGVVGVGKGSCFLPASEFVSFD
ncbi:hypothetical protein V8G54_012579 [Vigna mungo]|uniref:Transmembrane protein n=1 Tax=Vigna mungo TaxID=3915 RepID=A0AAQ3NT47_VIGMU